MVYDEDSHGKVDVDVVLGSTVPHNLRWED
jgi:hypothetical protein